MLLEMRLASHSNHSGYFQYSPQLWTLGLNSQPFPLGYLNCISQKHVRQFAEKAIQ